jgi:hypothetical protein
MRFDEHIVYEGEIASLRDQMDATAFASAWADGRAMDMEEAINYAVSPSDETAQVLKSRSASG